MQAYLDTQSRFISIYHAANELWSDYCAAEFGRKLKHMLEIEQWNDLNTTAVLWPSKHAMPYEILCLNMSHPDCFPSVAMQNPDDTDGMRLPAYATNALIEALLTVCKEIHYAHSGTLDEVSRQSFPEVYWAIS